MHYTTLRYTTLHHTTAHYTTLHRTTLHYTTLQYTLNLLVDVAREHAVEVGLALLTLQRLVAHPACDEKDFD